MIDYQKMLHPRTKQVFKLKTLWQNLVAEDTVNGDLAALTDARAKEIREQFESKQITEFLNKKKLILLLQILML